MLDASGLVNTTIANAKIGEVENKIWDVSGLLRKTDYNANKSDIDAKYFSTLTIINLQMK